MNRSPLYNSRVFRIFIEYLEKQYPYVDIDFLLQRADISRDEVEDPGHWFPQPESDLFFQEISRTTGNTDIAHEAGRYTAVSNTIDAVKQYSLGLLDLESVYLTMDRIYGLLIKGFTIRAKKLKRRTIEIVATPENGTRERFHQCQFRQGALESVAKLFTPHLATVDHPRCIHRGDDCCQYIIRWKKTPAGTWKQFQRYAVALSIGLSMATIFTLPWLPWCILTLSCTVGTGLVTLRTATIRNRNLTETIREQGDAARQLIDEMNAHYDNALLASEIGQAISTILDSDQLIASVAKIMEKRLDYDRGIIMRTGKDGKRLVYATGYGYTPEHEEIVRRAEFRLDRTDSKGIFVIACREQRPLLITNFSDVKHQHSRHSAEFASHMGIQSLICVPIVYEKTSLGIIAVDNVVSKRALTKSDISLLMGIAAQMAVSIVNAESYQKLKNSEEKYRELVENANSIILRMDTFGTITFFNEFAQKFFGYREDEIVGRNMVETIVPERDSNGRDLRTLIRNITLYPDRYMTSENENILRDGTPVTIAWTNKAIYNDTGTVVEILCIGNDITDLKRSERETKLLQSRLQRAEKMEALGTLAGGVAHDLNNILVGLVSYPELVMMQLPTDSPLIKPIKSIKKSGEKAAAIVQDLLTLARRGVGTTVVLNLNDIIREYMGTPEFENVLRSRTDITVITDLNESLMNIIGSPLHLSKTIMNLFMNAAEAMPEGGTITIMTRNMYIDRQMEGFEMVEEGEYAIMSISDSGIGIPREDLDRIFEPFYTKKTMGRSGTGLGLAVVWGTTQDHNGHIDVKSAEGSGTTFSLYFPVTRLGMTHAAERNILIDQLRGNGEAIAIVDDIEEQREIAASILRELGYSVTTFSNGLDMVSHLQNNKADLLVLDMIMAPNIDGLETYRRCLEINPAQKAIIVSGFSESDQVKQAQELGAGEYVKKPYLMETIGRAVKRELQNEEHCVFRTYRQGTGNG